MKRKKEIYKLGRKLMDSMRVPMTRLMINPKTGKKERHVSHYHKDELLKRPKRLPNGDYTTKKINIKAGQVRTRRPKTADEAIKYYGSAIDSTINSIKNDLASKYSNSQSASKPSNSSNKNGYQPKHDDSTYKKYLTASPVGGYMTKHGTMKSFKNYTDAEKYVDQLLSKH